MRFNVFAIAYWGTRMARAIWRRVTALGATRLHRATLAHVGCKTYFQSGVRFAEPSAVSIGAHCYFWQGCNASSEISGAALQIGDRVQVNLNVHLDITGGLTVGDDVLISQDVVIYTHDHGLDPHSVPIPIPKVIDQDVWIGMRAVILAQCHFIGRGAVIGAGAVVTRDVPAFAIVAGNPARVVGQRSDQRDVAA